MEQRNSGLQAANVFIVMQITHGAHVILIRIRVRAGIRGFGVLVFWPKLTSHHVQQIVRHLVFDRQEVIDVGFNKLGIHVAAALRVNQAVHNLLAGMPICLIPTRVTPNFWRAVVIEFTPCVRTSLAGTTSTPYCLLI